jgi:hypothetical protein
MKLGKFVMPSKFVMQRSMAFKKKAQIGVNNVMLTKYSLCT